MELKTLQEIIESAKSTKTPGALRQGLVEGWRIIGNRPAYLLAKYKDQNVRKHFEFRARFVNYGNKESVKNAHESGEVQRTPRTWAEKVSKGIIRHKKTGKEYLDIDLSKLVDSSRSYWTWDGRRVSKSEIEHMLVPSKELKKTDKAPEWITVNRENIESLEHRLLEEISE